MNRKVTRLLSVGHGVNALLHPRFQTTCSLTTNVAQSLGGPVVSIPAVIPPEQVVDTDMSPDPPELNTILPKFQVKKV